MVTNQRGVTNWGSTNSTFMLNVLTVGSESGYFINRLHNATLRMGSDFFSCRQYHYDNLFNSRQSVLSNMYSHRFKGAGEVSILNHVVHGN